jgi:hypothetical protein
MLHEVTQHSFLPKQEIMALSSVSSATWENISMSVVKPAWRLGRPPSRLQLSPHTMKV